MAVEPTIMLSRESDAEWTNKLITGLGGEMEVRRLFTKAMGASENFSFVMARTAPGGTHGWHVRPGEEEAILLLKGECTLSMEDSKGQVTDFPMKVGDAAFIPGGVKHMNRNTGDVENLIVGIHSPAPI